MKTWTITINKTAWHCRGVKLYLDDSGGNYNHPTLVVAFGARSASGDESSLGVELVFQRDGEVTRESCQPAALIMDTCRRWTTCYGGVIKLVRAGEVQICDRPFHLTSADRLRIEVARRIARAIKTYNLNLVSPCECVQATEALKRLAGPVEILYRRDVGGLVSIYEVEGRYANSRADDELRDLERQAGAL
jgi:hypothetical protein